ncbi:hypothetical protein [Legionella genomosp. 1]|uniref:hypothetical protein n=1 Tax=Legionella genomosp. 1 TaxID=1093625 RepID=UPI001056CF46|nr:hypothetical protein [Legionella genomosp. 1]
MKLHTQEEKTKFLKELYEHINRIYEQNLTHSDKKYFTPQARYDGRLSQQYTLKVSKEATDLIPSVISLSNEFSGNNFTVKLAKLNLLIALYNTVKNQADSQDVVDLDTIFETFKNNHNDVRITMYGYKDSEGVFKTHRREIQREGFVAKFLNFFFGKPKSEKFLEKYNFFKEPTRQKDKVDEFAEKFNLEAKLIESIEPASNKGIEIKAVSTEAAITIEMAVRAKLEEAASKKLGSDIRFLNDRGMPSNDEPSTTLEVWNEAYDILDGLFQEPSRQAKFE